MRVGVALLVVFVLVSLALIVNMMAYDLVSGIVALGFLLAASVFGVLSYLFERTEPAPPPAESPPRPRS